MTTQKQPQRQSLFAYYLAHPEEVARYTKKRGREWLSIPKAERTAIILAERFSLVAKGETIYTAIAGVYFVQEPLSGAIKIGIARDMAQRMITLQTSHPHRLKLLGHCPGGVKLEKQLHAEFDADRLEGEWFKVSDRLLARISELVPAAQ